MYFTAYFAENGIGKTGLSPLLYLYSVSDSVLVVNGETMTEVGRGGYKYNFEAFDNTESYMGDADSQTLTGSEKYAAPINTTSQGEVTAILTDTTAIEIDTTSIEGKVDTINTNVNAIPTTAMRGTDGVSLVIPDAAGTAPTAVEIREEIDSNSTRLDADITSRAPTGEYDTEMARITADVATEAKQDIIDTAVDAIPTTPMRGTDGANTTVPNTVIPDVAGTAATLHGTTDGKIDTVDSIVDAIKVSTDTINWTNITDMIATLVVIQAKTDTIVWTEIAAIKSVVDAIQVSTDTIDWTDVTAIKSVADAIQAKTDTIIWADVTFIKAIEGGKWEIASNQMIFYDDDNTTVIATFNLFDSAGSPAMTEIYKREVV